MESAPRVTLGVPLYNAERYLESCLDALLAQDYPDFEIIVSDNASTDRTWEICQTYAAKDARIRLYRNPRNFGGHVNYTRVVELARGELFKWVAYDDVCLPSYLRTCVAALDAAGPQAVLAYPRTVLIDESGEVIGPYADRLDLRDPRPWRRVARVARNINLCHAHFGVFRMSALRRTGMIRPFLSSDYTLIAEVARLGEIHEVAEPLFLRRMHGGSTRQAKGATPASALAWYGQAGRRVRAPRLRMLAETLRMLSTGSDPLGTRISSAAAFLATWWARRVRVRLGRLRRSVVRRIRASTAKGSA
ncbi:glycosyltransferase family 2 protein [Plantactinospora sp. S1510]|uniref:Glycosyltransferase family 2 protein n=1 Tax=Plantactinospora alkalitolerans TaxID=2789879 RepID=A0ABS0GYT4_9ACTN|nr:glycosyltransferase family 2 protein [Plantactinospora alkalitolerans]MBF9131037.1 glycosyltransferase family 2 protein [Plantactinospora alkalitolerans]